MPEEPLSFMVKYLRNKTGKYAFDVEAARKENVQLEAEIQQMKTRLQDAQSKAVEAIGDEPQGAKDESEEEDDDDDDVDEIPERPQEQGRARQSVSAEAYGAWNVKKDFSPPKNPKSDDQKKRIEAVLCKNFLFQALDPVSTSVILDAVKEKIIEKGERVIQQGDNGDFMFVVESGELDCLINKDGQETVVKQCNAGDAFGELALLYNCPRAASVQAKERSVCWELGRETFNHIVRDAAQKKREKFGDFLKTVPLLNAVDAYGRSQIADALKEEEIKQGVVIIKQGEPGDKFYIIEEGTCVATKKVAGQPDFELELKAGEYFGELALLTNEPRAATVAAKTDAKVLMLDRGAFNRLLGPLKDMLKASCNRYG